MENSHNTLTFNHLMSTCLLNYHLRLFFAVFAKKLIINISRNINLNFRRQETAICVLPARTLDLSYIESNWDALH